MEPIHMKPTLISSVLVTLLLAACSQTPGNETAAAKNATADNDMAMPAAKHAEMTAPPKAAADAMAQPAKTASATGMVESVDAAAGKIVIAHGPVDALQWPAMTMGFKATPEQIAAVKVSQKVRFEFQAQGMDATIAQIEPAE
jgi:Cu(I)/Ag(I) efflux system protein CusF